MQLAKNFFSNSISVWFSDFVI